MKFNIFSILLSIFEYIKQKTIIDIIFPPSCIVCGKLTEEYICLKCEKRFARFKKFNIIDNQKLIKDKLNIKSDNFKQKYYLCGNEKYYWEKMLYCFDYKNIVRKYMLKYKFNSEAYISNFFAKQILKNKKASEILNLYDIIIPVPMDKNKKRNRGYNQTELITKIISENLGIIEDKKSLIKLRKTQTQSTLSKEERKNNIKNAYLVNNKNIKHKRIILLDDIYTTGATINEISQKLKQAGVKEILVLVIAKD